ncbi:autotransporter domain-containing protein [Lysobacter zhanggongensis]|uniref:S8 family serine peptidase n=1 Tax=Lysobacter zhanggongensis TaxID=1774951 RepID=A0ABU7YQ10_9GAMM
MSKHAPRSHSGLSRSSLCRAIATCLLAGAMLPAMAQDAAPEEDPGQVGDAASWRTDEFMADWGLGAIGAEYAYARGLTGHGIRLGVFDSGVALDHAEFAGGDHIGLKFGDPGCSNLTDLWGCFYSDGGQASVEGYLAPDGYVWGSGNALDLEYNAHGTHVGGTMAAARNGSGMHGVAFGSGLVSAQLFTNRLNEYFFGPNGLDSNVHGTSPSDEALADMYAQMAANGVRAINHSWGFTIPLDSAGFADFVYDALGAGFFEPYAAGSRDHGMLQVWAAGNGGDDGVAGNGTGYYAGVTATLPRWLPELEAYWLSVANMNLDGEIDGSSNICGLSMDWCITAPGTMIASSVVWGELSGEVVVGEDGSLTLEFEDPDRQLGYAYYTGTSMAAPHVTGALALLMERYPYLDNAQIRDVLLTTARDMGAAGVDELYGWGLMDLRKGMEGYGQLRVDTDIVMDRRAGGAKVWEGEAWDDWTNDIGGPGRMTKSGIGWLRLSGDNSFAGLTVSDGVLELTGNNALGDTVVDGGLAWVAAGGVLANAATVNGGWLQVDGTQSGALQVNGGGGLRGIGTVGSTVVAGTIAPGNSIGTLSVAGDYTQLAGSYFDAELGASGSADLISISGVADLQGGTVRLFGTPGVFDIGASYTLLEASAVNGTFAGVSRGAFSPFLGFNLGYGADVVTLDVVRAMALAEAATTPNQRAVARAADAMADDAALLGSLVQLFPEQAQGAFDLLGGEFHPAARAVLVEDARMVREAALARTTPVLSALDDDAPATTAWAEAFKSGGSIHGDSNTGRVEHDANGVLVGIEHRFAGGWQVGVLGGTGRTDIDLRARASSGDVKQRHLGVYGGNQWGGLSLRAGLTRADQEIDGERYVAFADVDQFLHTEYDATTTQAFIEGGYAFGRQAWTLEPYLQVARVDVDTDEFVEDGGSAALAGSDAETRATLSTVGVRFDVGLGGAQQSASGLHLRGGLGYRHASGDLVAEGVHAWDGGTAFTVTGAPLAERSTVLEAGVAARFGARSLLEFGYSGQYADEARDHGANVRYSLKF